VADLTPPPDQNPEAIVAYEDTLDVQILFDMGDRTIGGTTCKKSPVAQKSFTDQILHIER
jgi:hypothetical protein